MTDAVDVIPEDELFTIGGEVLHIGPLKVRNIPAFTRAVRPCMAQLGGDDIDWLGLVADHGEKIIAAMAIATGKTDEWVGDLECDDLLRLVQKVMEVNLDFFAHRLMPVMRKTVTEMMSVVGRVSFSDSSAQVTASQTS